MKLTIDNNDGRGPVDYSAAIVAGRPFRIVRRLNEPVTCAVTLFPSDLAMPARNGRVIVSDDHGILLFTGYLATEPALELAGQGSAGAVYQAAVTAISDEILLDRQPLPQSGPVYGASSGGALQSMLARINARNITANLSPATTIVSEFQADSGRTWAANAGALASATRSAYLLMNGILTLTPVGTATHSLDETQGTLSLSGLELAMTRALANDVTVCGEAEPSAYVTEYFEGDGTTMLFQLTQPPWLPPPSKTKPLIETFSGPAINPQIWNVEDPGGALGLTSAGFTSTGGGSNLGTTVLSAISNVELGGGLVLELNNVQFGSATDGILNGLYSASQALLANCVAGFEIGQANGAATITPLMNGAVSGSAFTAAAGHSYTLRLRFYSNEAQRIQQSYYAIGAGDGTKLFGGQVVSAEATLAFEVQDTTNGVAATPVVLYTGSYAGAPPPFCLFAPYNGGDLACSIGGITVEQQGPVWVVTTPPNGSPTVRRLGTTAQGADCTVTRTGRLQFYPASTPQMGEVVAISYRTTRRSVARLASTGSMAAESNGGIVPGTACWIGSVTSPAPRSSTDCENAAAALLAVSVSRAAAWSGRYTEWNAEQQGDVWPSDVLEVSAASAGLTANLVVRSVQLDLGCGRPALAKYTLLFANDWAGDLAIQTSSSIPADAWLPLQPETTPPLANLNALTVTSLNGSAIQINTNVTAPGGGGFEVRRRDWTFTSGPGPDLVLRSPVANFAIPRQAAMEQYYVRMYDGSTPPNYSRFSAAIFVNLPLSQ
jgi:hypothetical protein